MDRPVQDATTAIHPSHPRSGYDRCLLNFCQLAPLCRHRPLLRNLGVVPAHVLAVGTTSSPVWQSQSGMQCSSASSSSLSPSENGANFKERTDQRQEYACKIVPNRGTITTSTRSLPECGS